MRKFLTCLCLSTWLLPAPATADLEPAAGRLLVATEEIRGHIFAKTVVLLLHYDDDGAMGIVVNRPTEVRPDEVTKDPGVFDGYTGSFYWGGPVQMHALRALIRTDSPPGDAEEIADSVHILPFDSALAAIADDAIELRFYIGYAGWAAGQLDDEMARGSWRVVPGTGEHVFSSDPPALWNSLSRYQEYRAALPPAGRAPSP